MTESEREGGEPPRSVVFKVALSDAVHAIIGGYPMHREVTLAVQSSGDNPLRVVLELTPDAARAMAEVLLKCADAADAIPLQ